MANSVTLRWTNKDRFFARLRAVVPQVAAEMAAANKKSAVEMVATAKRLVPEESGTLRESIRYSAGRRRGGFIVEAGGPTTTKPVRHGADASYDYALGQEYGTSDTPAQPFFWPAFRLTRKTHRGRVARALRKAIKDAGF